MANTNLISVTKQVIRAAAKFGIDEAGSRIMGSAWKPFKAMLSPVINELEKRFPELFLLVESPVDSPTADVQAVARQVIAEINSDKVLQQLILQGFNELDEGQYEIKNQINKLVLRLEAIEVSIEQLSETNDKKFDNVLDQLAAVHQRLDKQGESVGFSNQSVIFPLAFDLPTGSIEAYVNLYIAGLDKIQLSVDKSRPYSTVNIAVPKSGDYAYRLEHKEVTTLYQQVGNDFVPQLVPISSSAAGQITIQPNSVYKLERVVNMQMGKPGANTITMELLKVLSHEAQATRDREAMDYLDDLINSQ